MVAYAPMSSGWQGGGFLLLLCVLAYLGTAAWWLTGQQVIEIHDDHIAVQSWLGSLRRAQGRTIRSVELAEAALVFDSGKKLRLVGPRFRQSVWVAMWPRRDLDRLIEAFGRMGVSTRREW